MGRDDVAESGPFISIISKLEGLAEVVMEAISIPTDDDMPPASACIRGSEANAGGGLRESGPGNETGWFPNKLFSKPVCRKSNPISKVNEPSTRLCHTFPSGTTKSKRKKTRKQKRMKGKEGKNLIRQPNTYDAPTRTRVRHDTTRFWHVNTQFFGTKIL